MTELSEGFEPQNAQENNCNLDEAIIKDDVTNTDKKNNQEKYSQEQIDKAIKEYGLTEFVQTTLTPATYTDQRKKTVEESIKQLRNNVMLRDVLKSIPERRGAHPGKGLPCKTVLVETLYGLNKNERQQIEKLEDEWVEKTIAYANENRVCVKVSTVHRLKREYEAQQKAEEKAKKKAEKEAALAEKMDNPKTANLNDLFGAALIDLTQETAKVHLTSWAKYMKSDSVLFICVKPKDLPAGLELIQKVGFTYMDNVIWDRETSSQSGTPWSSNQHTMILIAVNGNPEDPHKDFRLQSVFTDYKAQGMVYIPDYYYAQIELMCPGEQLLEVFSRRKHSDSWFLYEEETTQTEGEN